MWIKRKSDGKVVEVTDSTGYDMQAMGHGEQAEAPKKVEEKAEAKPAEVKK